MIMGKRKWRDSNGRDREERIIHYAGDVLGKRTKYSVRKWWKTLQEEKEIRSDETVQSVLDSYRVD